MKQMLNFFRTAREPETEPDSLATVITRPDLLLLKAEIDRTRGAIDTARNHFEQVVDPTLIDCYIYELNAAQLRYQFLLRKFKNRELCLYEEGGT